VSAGHQSHLIVGGARSGKSRYAVALARSSPRRTAFLATARALDADMEARIARHQRERPASWRTVEEPFDVEAVCGRLARDVDLIVIDCLTLWVSNRLLRGDADTAVLSAANALAGLMGERVVSMIFVSNEVGLGVHPPTAVGRRFRDVLGAVNQRLAEAADRVTLMVAGIPLTVKAEPQPLLAHDRAPEAP